MQKCINNTDCLTIFTARSVHITSCLLVCHLRKFSRNFNMMHYVTDREKNSPIYDFIRRTKLASIKIFVWDYADLCPYHTHIVCRMSYQTYGSRFSEFLIPFMWYTELADGRVNTYISNQYCQSYQVSFKCLVLFQDLRLRYSNK